MAGRTHGRSSTLTDLAKQLQLSVATVSRALSDHPDVRAETRQRVRESAAAMGYRTSPVAKALRTGRHDALSVVLPYSFGWWEPLLKGAGRQAAKHGYRVILNPVGADHGDPTAGEAEPAAIDEFFEFSAKLPVDGYIVVTPEAEGWKSGVDSPVVIIDDIRRHPGHHVWLSDNIGGARVATEHLISRGRSRILAVAPDESWAVVDDRLTGYRSAIEAAGLRPLVLRTRETYPSSLNTSDAIDHALEQGVPFDGIFVLADYLAFSVLRSLRRAGLQVPDDVSVIGFDDDIGAVATDPTLSTMAQPLADLGARAVDTLVELIRGEPLQPETHLLDTRLVVRHST
jgi:LacI family transcriptional regulator